MCSADTSPLSRRGFLLSTAAGACLLHAGRTRGQDVAALTPGTKGLTAVQPARWFDRIEDKAAKCRLCPRECVVADTERGYCGVRENRGGDYKTLVYGALCSINIDPIEKKPFFHYLPGTTALSVATAGCNIECKFCQNWQVSQYRPEQVESVLVPPDDLVRASKERGSPTIAFTYTEPVVFGEFVLDSAAAARRLGIGSVMVSNGFIQEEPLREICRSLTAFKVDLKAFTEKFYAEQCAGKLEPVLKTLDILKSIGIHIEVVVLIVPTLNDSVQELQQMARWLFSHLGPDCPIHFSRFHPTYRIKNLPPTPVSTLERSRKVCMDAGMRYVYIGNVPFHEGESTYCPSCGKVVIKRIGYRVDAGGLKDGKCAGCSTRIPGVWSQQQALAARGGPGSVNAP